MKFMRRAVALLTCTNSVMARGDHDDGESFDFIVVGGGTSGLVIANRLSEDPNVRVAVIEAGDDVRSNPNVTDITRFSPGLGTQIDWKYPVERQLIGNRTLVYNQGKGLGGTSLINGMTYIRPEDAQIDLWEELGNEGWNWETLFPYYKRSETFQFPDQQQLDAGASFSPDAHGEEGPLAVGFHPTMVDDGFNARLQKALGTLGVPPQPEPNAGKLRGVSTWPMTLNVTEKIREDAARAYYYPTERRENVVVYLTTTASRLIWSESAESAMTAKGVEAAGPDGKIYSIFAEKEVILSAGSSRSPLLLERSGVGNPQILKPFGIKTVIDLPSVGENLQDQPNVPMVATSSVNFTGYPTFVAFVNATDLFGTETEAMYYEGLSLLDSWATVISTNSGGVLDTQVQKRLLKTQLDLMFKKSTVMSEILFAPSVTPDFSALIVPHWGLLPFSRGSVHMASTDLYAPPKIDPRLLQFEFDRRVQAATARMIRQSFSTPPLSDILTGEMSPGLEVVPANATDEQWIAYIESAYSSNYHPVGTAAMLPKKLGGVVDARLKVYGTSNVRVVDASVLPFQVCGHLTSTLYAVAERASDLIKEDCKR